MLEPACLVHAAPACLAACPAVVRPGQVPGARNSLQPSTGRIAHSAMRAPASMRGGRRRRQTRRRRRRELPGGGGRCCLPACTAAAPGRAGRRWQAARAAAASVRGAGCVPAALPRSGGGGGGGRGRRRRRRRCGHGRPRGPAPGVPGCARTRVQMPCTFMCDVCV